MRLREEVKWFAEQMERKLTENSYKGHWIECEPKYLFNRLIEEAKELESAPIESVVDEAADVANFAMMIADVARMTIAQRKCLRDI